MLCWKNERMFVHAWTPCALMVPLRFEHEHRTGGPHGARGRVEVAAAFLGDAQIQHPAACASKELNFGRRWLGLWEEILGWDCEKALREEMIVLVMTPPR
jgi:hypothetical protein